MSEVTWGTRVHVRVNITASVMGETGAYHVEKQATHRVVDWQAGLPIFDFDELLDSVIDGIVEEVSPVPL